MRNNFLFLLALTTVLFTKAHSQTANSSSTFIPASSQSEKVTSALGNYMAEYYTGRLNHGVSLRTVDVNGVSIPIGLSYSSTGNKVQDVSGMTGLAWNSQMGGAITREVHGIPDDWFYGYCGPNRTGGLSYSAISKEFFEKAAAGLWDGEPDKFYFSFLGIQGSFVLDADGNPLVLNNEGGVSVEHSAYKRNDPALEPYWILRDQSGIRYFFEKTELMKCLAHGAESNEYKIYLSAWNITKIVMPNGDEVNFSYNTGAEISYTNYSNVKRVDQIFTSGSLSCLGNDHVSDLTFNENQDITYKPNYLTKISGGGVGINFEYNLDRVDILDAKALTDIFIYYKNDKIDSYKLNYGYFTSTDGTLTKRLKLDNITQQAKGGNQERTLYKFYYNEIVNLPSRSSIKTDYLGYYNNNILSSNINHYGDKTPYLINTAANVLTSIENVMGGAVNFTYELNDYLLNGDNITAPGLRIKTVYETKNATDPVHYNELTISYKKPNSINSSGQIYSFYSSNVNKSLLVSCDNTSGAMTYYSSETQQTLADINGSNIGYTNATVTKADGSALRYTFTNYSDYPDMWQPGLYADNISSYNYNMNSSSPLGIYTHAPVTSFGYARGKILTEESLNATGQIVKSVNYTYSFSPSPSVVTALNISLYNTNFNINTGLSNGYNVNGYIYSSGFLQLSSKIEQFLNNNSPTQVNAETFQYCSYAKNLLRSITSSHSGKLTKVNYRYPFDVIAVLPSSKPISSLSFASLVYENIISKPVEIVKTSTKNGQEILVSASVTQMANLNPQSEYQLETNNYIPISQYSAFNVQQVSGLEIPVMDSHLKLIKAYTAYQNNRQLAELKPVGQVDRYQSLIYGYFGAYIIAETKNARLSDIAYTSFESTENSGGWNYSGYTLFELSAFTGKHQYNLSGGSMTKSGLLSSTDYFVSYWSKNAMPYTVSGTQGSGILLASHNGWNNFRHKVTNVNTVIISGSGLIDEVRLHPIVSTMVTHTYDPMVGETSITDESNRTIYSQYDEFHRLQFVRDQDKNIKESYCYNAAGEYQDCFNFVGNSIQTGTFYKNDCTVGTIGAAVTYTVNLSTYFAKTLSIANSLAQNDISVNGQDYANAMGSCGAGSIYLRVEISNYQINTYENDSENFGRSTKGDIWIRAYSDEQCTIPYTLTLPLNATIGESYNALPAYGSGGNGTTSRNFTIASGTNSYFYGTRNLDTSDSYTDPFSGSGYVTDLSYYYYELESKPTYIIKPSI